MTSADFVLLAVVAVSAIAAFVRGFVREVLGIAAWVAAAYVAFAGYSTANPIVRGWISNRQFADPATYAIVFVLALIVFTIITNLIGRAVRGSALGGLDRTLGLAYGVVRGALIGVVVYILAGLIVPPAQWPRPVRTARLLPATHDGAVWLASLLPEGFRPKVAAIDAKDIPPLPRLLTPGVIGAKIGAGAKALDDSGPGAPSPSGTPGTAPGDAPSGGAAAPAPDSGTNAGKP